MCSLHSQDRLSDCDDSAIEKKREKVRAATFVDFDQLLVNLNRLNVCV